MPATLVLLPSPLLGPVAWAPVAEALAEGGWTVVVADLPSRFSEPGDVLDAFVQSLPLCNDLVLVPHSNAGLYAASMAGSGRHVATVFVDAALPPAGASTTRLAPPELLDFLAGLVDADGRLPPWTRWWDDAEVDQLFPDAAWRRHVEASAPRLPLTYFESSLPVAAGWATSACAYLAFGATYAEELARARQHGWPVDVIGGGHLHMLHEPVLVAGGILRLLDRLGVRLR